MTRPSDFTRDRILRAAVRLFAERGYDATGVRALAGKARVNQAAVNYHFKSKEGLYREVLREAIRALTQHQLSHAKETQAMPRERALGEFVRDQLRPLSARDDVSRYIHILNWEAVRPTTVYRRLVSEEAAPFMGFAVDLMRRFMPTPIGQRWSWLPFGWSVSATFSYATETSLPFPRFPSPSTSGSYKNFPP
jgi:AcrR family transcriptional regulator